MEKKEAAKWNSPKRMDHEVWSWEGGTAVMVAA